MRSLVEDYFVERLGMFDSPKIVIVEGKDDRYFFGKILLDYNVSPDKIKIFSLDGKDKLASQFKLFVQSRAFRERKIRGYAIVRDADQDPRNALSIMHDILRSNSQPVPAHGAFESSADGVAVGLFVLPSVDVLGDLETLCFQTVKDTPHGNEVAKFFYDVEARFWKLDYVSKRLSTIYLSIMPGERCSGAGRGFVLGYFDREHAALDQIKAFIGKFIGL